MSFMRGVLEHLSITLNPFLWQSTESSPTWPPSLVPIDQGAERHIQLF